MIIALQTLIFFRESLIQALDRLLRPYYKHFSLAFNSGDDDDDDESDEQVFADFDEEKGVVFYPPMYAQRYAAVSDCLMDERWHGKIEKVVDLGYHDMSFIKYLKEVPGVTQILGVDIETIPLRCSSDLLGCEEYAAKRENPLQITLYQGNAADPDFRLIGCDAVIGIEMIEHMLPHDLDRLIHTVFGFIRPWIVIFTTPNADFNVLFKALEKNGLRRWDHFFEWSREQFNDWCSNVIVRYPEYTVSCKGVGPGPTGTIHVGCCSQMALFICKDYQKQDNLNINSLALVADAPSPNQFTEIVGNWESPDNLTDAMIGAESFSDFPFPISAKHSCTTIVLSPAMSLPTLDYKDKNSQCNLDTEVGKNFLMFDNEQLFDVMVPRKKVPNRVYVIEDVFCRLNCTTYQVKKFSKTTQNMMAKNKIDSLVHTREVVDEIRHLTRALDFNKDNQLENGSHIWHNFNWGVNAPYWNQYYKVVREYSYPFETKSEECRILDLISDEINRLIDVQYDSEFSVDVNLLEIPLHHLMRVVQHITDDVDKVRDLLEWNGYEITDDVVIHSRIVVDSASHTQDEEWRENDTLSDWDTNDVHSTSVSDGSTVVADYHGRCLRRALDQKVRKLRTMMTADEDITTELDRVVCKLMKLALRSSRGRQHPPPARWMQCKLLDLLTLTENAIDRRKRHFIETYPLKAIGYEEEKPVDMLALDKIKEDDTGTYIVDKYRHLLRPSDKILNAIPVPEHRFIELEIEDDFGSIISDNFTKEYTDRESLPPIKHTEIDPIVFDKEESKLERIQAWVDEDIDVVPYPSHDTNFDNPSSGDTDHSAHDGRRKQKRIGKQYKNVDRNIKRIRSKTSHDNRRDKHRNKSSNTRISKKERWRKTNGVVKKASGRFIDMEYEMYVVNNMKTCNEKPPSIVTSNPIPEGAIELSFPKPIAENTDEFKASVSDTTDVTNETITITQPHDIAATKDSLLIDIITDGFQETVAMRRTVGTDAENDSCEDEKVIRSFSNDFCTKHYVSSENVQSQTIFLNDINEPSTSKGIRHVSMDVQCGPDVTPVYSALSASTSLCRVPDMTSVGVKLNNLLHTNNTEFGTTMQSNCYYDTRSPRMRSIGIKIRDSDVTIIARADSYTMMPTCTETPETVVDVDPQATVPNAVSPIHTELIKPVSSTLKLEDSTSDFNESISSYAKSPVHFTPNTTKEELELSECKEARRVSLKAKYIRPTLSRGGVYVHSYKDKQVSEDVVFQGEWQRCRPKAIVRKKAFIPSKKAFESTLNRRKVNSKEKLLKLRDKSEVKIEPKKCVASRTYNPSTLYRTKYIRDPPEKTVPPVVPRNVTKDSKLSRHVTSNVKVANTSKYCNENGNRTIIKKCNFMQIGTKVTTSADAPKNIKFSITAKKIAQPLPVKKNNGKPKESHIPIYLKRNKQNLVFTNKTNLNKSIDSVNAMIKINKTALENPLPALVRCKTEEIDKGLLRFTNKPRGHISFVVFRNEKDDKKDHNEKPAHICDSNVMKPGCVVKRIQSYQSPNSSTCSSPNSVATVRAAAVKTKNPTTRRHSLSPHKSNVISTTESESSSPNKTKKIYKRSKSEKRADGRDVANKENIPEPSNKSKINNNENEAFEKTPFTGRHKNVFIAQMKTASSHLQTQNSVSKHQTKSKVSNKSNIRIPTQVDATEIKKNASTSVSRKRSSRLSTTSNDLKFSSSSPERSNMVLVLESRQSRPVVVKSQNVVVPAEESVKNIDNRLLTDWMQHSSVEMTPTNSPRAVKYVIDDSVSVTVRQFIEEILELIDAPLDDSIDSQTVILSRDDCNVSELSASPISFKTVLTNEDASMIQDDLEHVANSFIDNDLEHALNRTFESILGDESIVSLNDTRLTVTDLDFLSLKSATSASKYSEYFLADSELNERSSRVFAHAPASDSNSVRDIFERKEPNLTQNPPGALALQVFSGFSIAGDPVGGDQPDPVSIIDSETGSTGLDVCRQATSEELFVSGRSSDSYESCVVDEDAVVPNWLFNIISQQQSELVDNPEVQLPVQLPLPDALYDVNGNVDQGIAGVGAGAGDGRGMHSDHSQDSSGRGTSLSSSEVSSDPQSQAILIEPSAYVNQYELMREPVDGAVTVPIMPSDSTVNTSRTDGSANTTGTSNAGRSIRTVRPPLIVTSDVDADVSSNDTDVPDSSDN